jgi:predicted Zn-ribbon and HTH transcriptional regulator
MSIAEIFRQAIRRNEVHASYADWKIINDILRCRTPEMGGHLYECRDCGNAVPVYNSCRNRHCPKCQGEGSAKWLEARCKELLPVPYFHGVQTVPHDLNGIFLQNKSLLFGFLFKASSKALQDIAKRRLRGSLGFFSVLHSWGKQMEFHPHVHIVLPGVIMRGGDIEISPENYLLPKNALSVVFRAIFIKLLVRAYKKGKLTLTGTLEHLKDPASFYALIRTVKNKHWISYLKKPFSGPESVLKYLALYTHRVAISEKRIVSVKDGSVSFTYKDYADECKEKVLTVSVGEFTRRFFLHTLPKAFVRIRYYGFLAPGKRKREFKDVKGHFNIKRPIALLPLKPRPCTQCGSVHLVKTIELPKIHVSSHSHKTKVLPLVA